MKKQIEIHKIDISSNLPLQYADEGIKAGFPSPAQDYLEQAIDLNKVKRGDLIALRSAGAYGEIMASGYNCRELPKGYTSDELV